MKTVLVADLCVRSVPCMSDPEAAREEVTDALVEGEEDCDGRDGEFRGDIVGLNMFP